MAPPFLSKEEKRQFFKCLTSKMRASAAQRGPSVYQFVSGSDFLLTNIQRSQKLESTWECSVVGNCRGSDGRLLEKKNNNNKKENLLFSFCFFSSMCRCRSWSVEKTFSCLQALYGTQHQPDPALCPLSALEKPQGSQQHNLMVLQAGANQRSEKLI